MSKELTCFKAYDVRGELGLNLNGDICYRIGRAYAEVMESKTVIIGRDVRKSSPELSKCFSEGLMDNGVKVLDIGIAGTEEVYWATTHFSACGGIMITASHNPISFNGIKMVKSESRPLETNEFLMIKKTAENNSFPILKNRGKVVDIFYESKDAYVNKLFEFIDTNLLPKLNIVINGGNGALGPTFDLFEEKLQKKSKNLKFFKYQHNPDSNFPNGIPNPLIKENHQFNKNLVISKNADLGIAFDGDFDRCFFFDENGNFVPGEYIVGLLAEIFLLKEPGSKIIHDSRVIWNIKDVVENHSGYSLVSKTGHAFIKKSMRDNNAIYGGEMSAHHYFREFAYCDSGMIPWLLIIELMGRKEKKLSELVKDRQQKFPSSGEINFTIKKPEKMIEKVLKYFQDQYLYYDYFDGLSVVFEDWRFNLRISNTEPLVRLNLETKKNLDLLNHGIKKLTKILLGD